MKKVILTLFHTLLLIGVLNARPVITADVIDGICKKDGKITINATNVVAPVTYSIKELLGAPTSNNVFANLEAREYTIEVYDGTTGPNSPVTMKVEVKTSYVDLEVSQIKSAKDYLQFCDENGQILIDIKEGKPPYKFRALNPISGAIIKEETSSELRYYLGPLISGSYNVEIEDACGEIRRSIAPIAVVSDGKPWVGTIMNSLDLDQTYAIDKFERTCDQLSFELDPKKLTLINQHNVTIDLPTAGFGNFKMRVEYPLGTFSSWKNTINRETFRFANYNSANTQYRVQVQFGCDLSEISTSIYNLPPEGSTITDYNVGGQPYKIYENFCDYYDSVHLIITTSVNNAPNSITGICNDKIKVEIKEQGGSLTIDTLWTKNLSFGISDPRFKSGKTYDVKLTNTRTAQVWNKTATISTISTIIPDVSNFLRWNNRYIQLTCDLDKQIKIEANKNVFPSSTSNVKLSNHRFNEKIKYTMLSGPDMRPPVTKEATGKYTDVMGDLWTGLKAGTYTVELEFSSICIPNQVETLVIPNYYDSHHTVPPTFTSNQSICKSYTVHGKAWFVKAQDGNIDNGSQTLKVISGPEGTGHRDAINSWDPNGEMHIDNLPPGDYVFGYRQSSCDFKTYSITLPDYTYPEISVPLSGGISCTAAGATLTIVATGSSVSAFEYRYKAQGAGDETYSPYQSSNQFPNCVPGYYTVQVRDACAVTTQNVRVFNGTEQFVSIISGELTANSGVICFGHPATLSVLSIGPVVSYQWYKKNGATWNPIAGATFESYTITKATEADKGVYKVLIHNGTCPLESEITIADVQKTEIPSININRACVAGVSTTTLTAVTSIVSPYCRWFKNGVLVEGNNTPTLTNATAGSYRLMVTQLGNCPSDSSEIAEVVELFCAEILALDHCSFNPKLSLASYSTDATYEWLRSTDNGVTWNVVGTDHEMYTVVPGLYKVERTLNGVKTETDIVKLVVKKKIQIVNRWWYEIALE